MKKQLSTKPTGSLKDDTTKAYIAGFLDGDGCINAQILRRPDYRLGFQIRVSVTFFQSTKRHWFLLQIQKMVPGGTLRKRKDGISEYAFVGSQVVQRLCESLLIYLVAKKRQATLLVQITQGLKKNQSREDFLTLCHLVDQIGALNDSKKRTGSVDLVQSEWKKLFPVETSDSDAHLGSTFGDIFSGEKKYNTPTPTKRLDEDIVRTS